MRWKKCVSKSGDYIEKYWEYKLVRSVSLKMAPVVVNGS